MTSLGMIVLMFKVRPSMANHMSMKFQGPSVGLVADCNRML
jgi:hypothetical protein